MYTRPDYCISAREFGQQMRYTPKYTDHRPQQSRHPIQISATVGSAKHMVLKGLVSPAGTSKHHSHSADKLRGISNMRLFLHRPELWDIVVWSRSGRLLSFSSTIKSQLTRSKAGELGKHRYKRVVCCVPFYVTYTPVVTVLSTKARVLSQAISIGVHNAFGWNLLIVSRPWKIPVYLDKILLD